MADLSQQQNQQSRPPIAGGNVRGGRFPPRGQHRVLPKDLQQQLQQRRTASSRSQPTPQPKQQFRQQPRQQPPVNNVAVNDASKGEALTQKVQGAMNAIRQQREQQFRSRNNAQERVRQCKESLKSTQQQLEEETTKDETMTKALAKIVVEIQEKEESNKVIKSKYEFNHQDLIRKREKIAELKLAIKQEEEKQKKVTGRSRVLREQQTSVVEVLEAKESKPVIFRALLGKRQQRMDDKKDDSFKKSKLRHQTKSEKRLLQDLEALHAQSCLLMLPNMIRGKVVAVTKQTEASEKDIVRLKAMLEKVNASKGGSFGSHTVSKPSNKMSQVMTGP